MKMLQRVIILAAGDSARWENFRGTPKHRIDIDGTSLIERQIGQFSRYTRDVIVVLKDASESFQNAEIYVPENDARWLDVV